MPDSSRQAIAKEKRVCFSCLKPNHASQWGRNKCKCEWCGKKHLLLMCRNLPKDDSADSKVNEVSINVEQLTLSCNNRAKPKCIYKH